MKLFLWVFVISFGFLAVSAQLHGRTLAAVGFTIAALGMMWHALFGIGGDDGHRR